MHAGGRARAVRHQDQRVRIAQRVKAAYEIKPDAGVASVDTAGCQDEVRRTGEPQRSDWISCAPSKWLDVRFAITHRVALQVLREERERLLVSVGGGDGHPHPCRHHRHEPKARPQLDRADSLPAAPLSPRARQQRRRQLRRAMLPREPLCERVRVLPQRAAVASDGASALSLPKPPLRAACVRTGSSVKRWAECLDQRGAQK
eukprot:6214110-Pleurochrysis_carterae.AAC.8